MNVRSSLFGKINECHASPSSPCPQCASVTTFQDAAFGGDIQWMCAVAPVRLRLLQGGIKGSLKDLDASNTGLGGLWGRPRANAIVCFFPPSEGWEQEVCGRGG